MGNEFVIFLLWTPIVVVLNPANIEVSNGTVLLAKKRQTSSGILIENYDCYVTSHPV